MRIFLVVAGLGLIAAGGIAAGNDRNLYIVTHVDIAAHTKRFREKLQPMLGSPYREGLHRPL